MSVVHRRSQFSKELDTKWGSLDSGVVDAVLEHFKHSGEWLKVFPCLRLVNKHWSDALNKHVNCTFSYSRLQASDFNSFHKFPNMITVNLPDVLGTPVINSEAVKRYIALTETGTDKREIRNLTDNIEALHESNSK